MADSINKQFVKTGIVDTKYGKIINDAFENRSDNDYGLFVDFTNDEVQEMYKEMQEFINEIKKYL